MRIPRHSRMLTATLVAAAAATAAVGPLLSAGADTAGVYRRGEFDLVRNILPPGQTGFLSATQAAQEKANGTQAQHQSDQLGMYADLVKHAPNVTQAIVDADYKDASFGVRPGDVASTETPRSDVTVIRDRSFGVPHVYGTTDAGTVFGAGWIDAEDRLFLTDVLRHYGRSTLASFLGPDRSFIEMDCAQAQLTGYSEAELDAQIAHLPTTPVDFPALAQQYVDGINAYIDATLTDPNRLPAEYLAFGLRPQHFNVGDIVAIAGLVGGIFGKGGGVETRNAQFLRALFTAFGGPTNAQKPDPTTAMALFKDMMESDDPGAPTTVAASFPWESRPQPDPNAYALTRSAPGDPVGTTCSVTPNNVPLVDSAAAQRIAAGLAATPHAMSNALLVDGQHSTTGRPIAVFGPQVSYYEPQILMEEDLHGPDFDVRGSSFPGTNFVVELGHGPDYAWSATSAGTDNVDQFAERLCNPTSTDPLQSVDPQSTSYMHDGRCIPMYERTQTELATPTAETLAGGSPSSNVPRQVTMKIERTVHGPVLDRTTAWVDGREVPVAISSERTTFMHEADSVLGFAYFNDPAYMTDAQDFLTAAAHIDYTFNWFYIDDRDIAYYQSGLLPTRAAGVHPDLPTWGTGQWDWQGNWDWSTASIGDRLGDAAHVHAIDPPGGVMTSWNNKGGVGFRASDDQWSYGDVFRSQSLDAAIASYLGAEHGHMSLVDLVNAMESAATVDLRGAQLLPDVVRLAGTDPSVSAQVATLAGWLKNGAHRRDLNGDGIYDEVKAVELMNAFYPRLLHAMFGPSLQSAFAAVPEEFDDAPSPIGSAYIEGWYGYAQKALDEVVGNHVAQPYQALRCADGTVAGCRAAVVGALKDAAANASTDDRGTTTADDIHFSAVGLGTAYEIPWQNRPTFQQVVDIPGHRPRPASSPALAAEAVAGASVSGLPMTSPLPAGGGAVALLAGALTIGALRRRRRRAG